MTHDLFAVKEEVERLQKTLQGYFWRVQSVDSQMFVLFSFRLPNVHFKTLGGLLDPPQSVEGYLVKGGFVPSFRYRF